MPIPVQNVGKLKSEVGRLNGILQTYREAGKEPMVIDHVEEHIRMLCVISQTMTGAPMFMTDEHGYAVVSPDSTVKDARSRQKRTRAKVMEEEGGKRITVPAHWEEHPTKGRIFHKEYSYVLKRKE